MGRYLSAVWFVGSALTALQFQAVVLALFSGGTALAVVLAVAVPLAVALFAGAGTVARPLVPLTRRTRGLWVWAAGVYALGTAGAFGVLMLQWRDHGLELGALYYPAGGVCYALAAALFLPGARARLATLVVTAACAGGVAFAAWEAGRPPTADEWIGTSGVDRAFLRVGDPPPGYALGAGGGSRADFGVSYDKPGAAGLRLTVRRDSYETERADARGCPVPFGEKIRCTDDGGGRLLVDFAYDTGYARSELRLRRDGLVHTVTLASRDGDLAAARGILTSLRPATDAEIERIVAASPR
ncbi:hypothetical protein [Streptomyces sp. NPDC000410]|uniref:hypothetical protein n=1 Tax=Streptomyces sp. NPDC000410 TaxID=3154254 RepID=UPI0033270DC3